MQISDGLTGIIAREVKGHIPVIAVGVESNELQLLQTLGFNLSEEPGTLPASLTTEEINEVAQKIKTGILRHNRPMPRRI